MGAVKADQGKLAEAEKLFQEVAQKGDQKYASLAKFSLAQLYFGDGRADLGEKTFRDLIDHPTLFVSKEQATLPSRAFWRRRSRARRASCWNRCATRRVA